MKRMENIMKFLKMVFWLLVSLFLGTLYIYILLVLWKLQLSLKWLLGSYVLLSIGIYIIFKIIKKTKIRIWFFGFLQNAICYISLGVPLYIGFNSMIFLLAEANLLNYKYPIVGIFVKYFEEIGFNNDLIRLLLPVFFYTYHTFYTFFVGNYFWKNNFQQKKYKKYDKCKKNRQ